MIELNINNQKYQVENAPDTPLLWVLRDSLKMTGTKYGCGVGQCGACTVHLDGIAVRSCLVPVGATVGKSITTIEGIGSEAGLSPVQ
jgi:isoquinoline 1-oxidoreductase alpha subunit